MAPAETTPEDELADIVSACDEALAEGNLQLPDVGCSGAVSPQQARLLKGLECVRLLREVWPRDDSTLRPHSQATAEIGPAPKRVGRFQILHELGRGGFGVVYLAVDPHLGRRVALKVPRPDIVSTPHLRERFRKEARAAAALDHPNVVAVHDTGDGDGLAFIAAAYCPGPTLAKWLAGQRENVPFALAAEWMAQLADGVQHAHDHDILHRDLKPENVMLVGAEGEKLTPKITDFGLARAVGDNGDEKLTVTGAIIGTPSYLAPEQTGGKPHAVGPGVDVYGLGAILYETLTLRPPFASDSTLETLRQVRSEDPLPPRRLRAQVPRDLETICLKCLEKDPARRYGSAKLLAADLRRFLAGEPILARPTGRAGRTLRWAKRRPAIAALLATVLLLLALGVPSLTVLWRRAAADRDTAQAHLGARSIALARAAWMTDDFDLARAALTECPEDLRTSEWHYLTRVCHAEKAVLNGHTWTVDAMAFSPDGRTLASVATTGQLIFWDVETGRELSTVSTLNRRTTGVAFKPDGKSVIVTGRTQANAAQSQVFLVEVDVAAGTQRPLWTSPGPAFVANMSPDFRTAVWTDQKSGLISHVDLSTGTVLVTLPVPERGQAFAHEFTSDGSRVASTLSLDNSSVVVVWDAATGKKVSHFKRPEFGTWGGARFSPDGLRVAVVHNHNQRPAQIAICTVGDGREVKRYTCGFEQVSFANYTPDGRHLLVGSNLERYVVLLDVETGKEVLSFRGHTRKLNAIACSPDGRYFATGGADWAVRIWHADPPAGD